MLPILNIGPLAVPLPPMLLLVGFWLGLELTEKQSHRYGANPSQIYNMSLVAVIAGLVGARLVYAARAPGAFLASPINLLALRPEMLDGMGGLVFAGLGALAFLYLRKMPLWSTLDAATTLFSVLAITIGLSNFASGAAFGTETNLPWAVELWGARRHPTQAYETLAALLIAAAVWPGGRVSRASELPDPTTGLRFWVFLALSAAARLLLESFRGDSELVLNMFRQAQVIAWLVLAASLWQIGRRIQKAGAVKDPAPPTGETA